MGDSPYRQQNLVRWTQLFVSQGSLEFTLVTFSCFPEVSAVFIRSSHAHEEMFLLSRIKTNSSGSHPCDFVLFTEP